MKDFKSYNGGTNANGGNNGNGGNGAGGVDKDKGIKMVNSIAAAMSGRSENEILRAVIAEAERGKRNGTLNNADLDNFYAAVAPTLDGFKRKKLKEIIIRLKKI